MLLSWRAGAAIDMIRMPANDHRQQPITEDVEVSPDHKDDINLENHTSIESRFGGAE